MGVLSKPTTIAKKRSLQSVVLNTEGKKVLDAYEYGCKCSDVFINNEEGKLVLVVKPPSDSEIIRVRSFIIDTDQGQINHPVYWMVIDSENTFINGNKL